MMYITLQANNYPEGKANEAMTKVIADAYVEGYKAGYKDCEAEIPVDLHNDKAEYVDLGLPSHTLWATKFEEDEDGQRFYLPYCEAKRFKLPTREQWDELVECCKIDYSQSGCTILGLNGQRLLLPYNDGIYNNAGCSFWIESEIDSRHENICGAIIFYSQERSSATMIHKFMGEHKNILVVK